VADWQLAHPGSKSKDLIGDKLIVRKHPSIKQTTRAETRLFSFSKITPYLS
jgi:hypothetical protein